MLNLLLGSEVSNRLVFYVIKDIKAGDDVVMDYNQLDEPGHFKEEYYTE